jgi:hypothetical protein
MLSIRCSDDLLIRLDPIQQNHRDGRFGSRIYELSVAMVEALIA